MPLKNIHQVYLIKPGKDGTVNRHLAGRFLTAGNHLHILDDYHNILGRHLDEGPLDLDKFQQIHDLYNSQYLHVANQHDIDEGKHPELLPVANLEPVPQRPPSSFTYQHNGTQEKNAIEFKDGVPHCDGVPTTHAHINSLLQNVHAGLGVVRYRKDPLSAIKKMEDMLTDLMKAGDVSEAFTKLRELVKAGHLSPEHERILADHVFKDAMIPELGNKFAFGDHMARCNDGVHIALDGNDFRSINERFGHVTGDDAIKAMGRAVREASDETAKGQAKAFRIGGDEMMVHLPSHEYAAQFARTLRAKLEAIPSVGGSHKLSMSMGIGIKPEEADKALYEAKKQKYTPETAGLDESQRKAIYPKGSAPSLAHSLVPGFEGAIPLDTSGNDVKAVAPPAPRAEGV